MAGENLVAHTAELWQVLSGVIALLIGILAFTYRGLIARVKNIESQLTNIVSEDKCKAMQGFCPHGGQLALIAADTKSIKDTIKDVMQKQDIMRQTTLPKEYLAIADYDKTHQQLERLIEKNMFDIKELIRELKIEIKLELRDKQDTK